MNFADLFAVALGGALGSLSRYLVSIGAGRFFGMDLPWGTLIVNIAGCFIMGVLIETFALRGSASEPLRAFLMIGFCGGFTTFSAFSSDAVYLLARGPAIPLLYVAGSVVLSIGALYAGLLLMRALLA